ncbi:xylem cysteine proteinase [Fistulifera solaris]|uniref:Xylem cysteine proteinase n=1 Tax=Fistulifera solaris TaxID=1519565 RepID=A0A1Z5KN89_FISSO|nr:xylem cysteine proteinase [Fistulifera solaris]|eukprot:GAX27800.1 xylem cysteine proteinase [Fistulifera solaris]
MKLTAWSLLFVFGLLIPFVVTTETSLDAPLLFQSWAHQFGKKYDTVQERAHRMQVWMQNHVLIQTHNQKDISYKLGHNEFSDLTWEEFQQRNRLGQHSPGLWHAPRARFTDTSTQLRRRRATQRPDQVDWVERGAVPPVKNQGMCGSCWAFSAIGAIEGAHFVDTGKLVALSEQQLIDCDSLDSGCMGGLMDNAFLFAENMTGICAEEDYPYAGHKHWLRGCFSEQGLCETVQHTRVQSFVDVGNTVDDLLDALAEQPVSVAIEADQQVFQFYKSGVFADDSCGDNLDHGVLAVGYGTEDGQDYFKVRNSWGATWGEEGYIKMARTSAQVNGTCGILSWASRPVLRENF